MKLSLENLPAQRGWYDPDAFQVTIVKQGESLETTVSTYPCEDTADVLRKAAGQLESVAESMRARAEELPRG